MKHFLVIIAAIIMPLCITSCIQASQPTPQTPVTVNFSVGLSNAQNTQSTLSSTNTSSAIAQVENHITHLPYRETAQWIGSIVSTWMRAHWFGIMSSALLLSYASMRLFLYKEELFLDNHENWSMWRSPATLEELCAYPNQELKELLIKTISARYLNSQNPTDYISPLVTFVTAIKYEQARLQRYITLTTMLAKVPCGKLMPTLHTARAREYHQKLTFIYHIFVSWASDLNWQAIINQHVEKSNIISV